jgi:hypothetical protein
MWRELETEPWQFPHATAPVPDPTRDKSRRKVSIGRVNTGQKAFAEYICKLDKFFQRCACRVSKTVCQVDGTPDR